MENTKDDKPILKSDVPLVKTIEDIAEENFELAKADDEKERSFKEGLANNSDTEKK